MIEEKKRFFLKFVRKEKKTPSPRILWIWWFNILSTVFSKKQKTQKWHLKINKQTNTALFLSFLFKQSIVFIFSKFRHQLDFAILLSLSPKSSLEFSVLIKTSFFFLKRDLHKLKVTKQPLCQPSALAHICQIEFRLKFRLWT